MKFETEAVMLEITKDGSEAKCRFTPIAGGTAVEIGGTRYSVGRQETVRQKTTPSPPPPVAAKLWPLNSSGATETEFSLADGLDQWVVAAWQAQRKVRLVVDDAKHSITRITLL